jgi:hypothetical protein
MYIPDEAEVNPVTPSAPRIHQQISQPNTSNEEYTYAPLLPNDGGFFS